MDIREKQFVFTKNTPLNKINHTNQPVTIILEA